MFLFSWNNDMKVISPQWMTRLTEKALRPDCGVVGGLLLYEGMERFSMQALSAESEDGQIMYLRG